MVDNSFWPCYIPLDKGSSDSIGKSWWQKILTQPKVLKVEEYCMYFPLSELHGWGKRFAIQPPTIDSELPQRLGGISQWKRS